MSSIYLLSHPTNCTQEQFLRSLKDVADSKTNSIDSLSVLPEIDASQVVQCVVGPNHLAFLMLDGSICRVAYHVVSDKPSYSSIKDNSEDEILQPSNAKKPTVSSIGESSTSQTDSFTLSGDALNTLTGTLGRWTHRVNVPPNSSAGTTSSSGASVLTNRVAATRGRGRIIRAARGRAGTGWLSSRAVIPASAVPEELISQAQIVLQGKSRQVIIRELQKTSLDVNLAVNNLLSRDDDEPDEPDEETYMQDSYVPSEDLMSIFEAGIPGDEPFVVQRDAIFPEDLIYNPSYSRVDSTVTTTRSSSNNDKERWWGMLMMDGKDKPSKSNSKQKSSKTTDTSYRFGEIQWWKCDEDDESRKFVQIASLHSELLAICNNGLLHQWYWNHAESPTFIPDQHNHDRANDLKITRNDKIIKIATCNIRATILFESGKMATWLDKTLAAVAHCLEHDVQTFNELKSPVVDLHVCDLYSCVQLANGQLYWWGVFPYEQRKKILDKVKTKAKKSAIAGSSQVKPGTLVCIRSCPLYYPGAVGFTTVNGVPKVGKLLDKAWSITEKCRFKITDNDFKKSPVKKKEETKERSETSTETTGANNDTEMTTSSTDANKNDEATSSHGNNRKRKYVEVDVDDDAIEEWCLQDVIFVEEVRNVPVGEVLKVDGAYAIVHFSSNKLSQAAADKNVSFDTMLNESVIRRKDELQIVKWSTPPSMPECYQKNPKQLTVPISSKVLSISLDKQGVHVILKTSTGVRYTVFSLATGRVEPGGYLQQEPAMFLSKPLTSSSNLLHSAFDAVSLLRDPNGCLYPLLKDNLGGIQNPSWLNLMSISSFACGTKKTVTSQLVVNVLVLKDDELLQNVLKCDVEAVEHSLKAVQAQPDLIESTVNLKCDGNRNLLHVCVSTCQPSAKKSNTSNNADRSGSKEDLYEPSLWIPLFDGSACLDLLLKSEALKPNLFKMLSQKDAYGYTPFMIAVRIRAYDAALKLYDAMCTVANDDPTNETSRNNEKFLSMIYPTVTDYDMSPLHVLCCNDTCSFTWTGTKHINQDIFECKTCGLVGPLCCCTECAQVCHIGHDCKLKHTSPTAYCDCWEKCPCKALKAGDQQLRIKLLHKLIDETDLSVRPNKKGQHILLFLAQTVARQAIEQSQYIPNRMNSNEQSNKRSTSSSVRNRSRQQTPPPDHDLEPPKFAKLSLTYCLKNWQALKSMILFGCQKTGNRRVNNLDDHVISTSMLHPDQINKYLDSQYGTSQLDNFVHKILVKCNGEYLEHILQTIESQINSKNSFDEVITVTRRFIRSVIRVFVILTACSGSTSTTSIKKKGMSAAISKCKQVFVSLNVYAAEELAHIAASIYAPVRMGVVYPSPPFSLSSLPDNAASSDDLFSATPMPERSSNSQQGSAQRVRFSVPPVAENSQVEESQTSQSSVVLDDSTASQQESDMDVDLMAESDSDSEAESNHEEATDATNTNTSSNQTRNRSLGNGYFSTIEASETDGEEEVEDDDEDEDDEDEEEDEESNQNNQDNTGGSNEQRTTTDATPHALQWAVRNNQNTQSSAASTSAAAHVSGGSGLVFIDTAQFRRSAASASNEGSSGTNSMFCTPSALARTFAILIRELSDIQTLYNNPGLQSATGLPFSQNAIEQATLATSKHLLSIWQWLWNVMETTEAQLRFGSSLTAVSDPNHPQHPLYENQTKSKNNNNTRSNNQPSNILRSWNENRRKKRGAAAAVSSTASDVSGARHEYLSYILSLMRSHGGEHGDSLPKVEITSLRHVAYILDAFIYYLRSKQPAASFANRISSTSSTSNMKTESTKEAEKSSKPVDDDEDESEVNDTDEQSNDNDEFNKQQQQHRFFKRSDSTLALGYEPADPYTVPLQDALPVADRPHLLNPTARRNQLFGVENDQQIPSCPEHSLTMKLEREAPTLVDEFGYLNLPPNVYLGRWNMCLELFGRVFLDDVGTEPSSVLNELGRFGVKEVKFRRELEKLRSNHQKDLLLDALDRARPQLLQQSLRQLNSQFGRRLPGAGPMNIQRLKVSFKDELGEGSGVVRSFYTAISNAFLANENLPTLDSIFTGSRGLTHQLRARAKERERERRRSSGGGSSQSGLVPRIVRKNERADSTASEIENYNLSIYAPPFTGLLELDDGSNDEDYPEASIPIHKRELARRILKKLANTHPEHANKITGMLLELTQTQLIYLLTHEDLFKEKVNEGAELLGATSSGSSSRDVAAKDSMALDDENQDLDNEPLFFQPGKPGFYSPRAGKNSSERLNCMRNVGRVVGLCLLQNEICSLSFNRHVIKYMLGRKISWHDLAFFDPTLYESLRQLLEDAKRDDNSEFFSALDLTFCVQLRQEEGGESVDLVKGGSQVEVAPDNVHDYVRKYAEYRMLINARRALQAMRRGLLDVIPSNHLEGLTAEDFRLLLNGAGDINVQQLMSYTFFSDETGGEGQDKLTKFKKCFWSMVETMTSKQKQDLLYFWTSSPAMPASAEGYQPMPSVTVKPANDHQLPTANTCISRLYVPLYSSKAILKSKFLLAIKTKVFGFV